MVVAWYVTTVFASTRWGLSIAHGTASVQFVGSFSDPIGGRAVVGPMQSTPTFPHAEIFDEPNEGMRINFILNHLGKACNMSP